MIQPPDESQRRHVSSLLPRLLESYDGPDYPSFYLGNGKDGTVFRLHNPDHGNDLSLDGCAVKVWNPSFTSRSHETRLHAKVAAMTRVPFRVPQLIHEDQRLGCFVMERVFGETAYAAIFRRKRRISESFFDKLQDCFRELNAGGIDHHDAHTGNYMLAHVETVVVARSEVIVDAEVWIIDFGRSVESRESGDTDQLEGDLRRKVVPDPD